MDLTCSFRMCLDNGTIAQAVIIEMVLLCCMVNTACTCQQKICGSHQKSVKIPCCQSRAASVLMYKKTAHQFNAADNREQGSKVLNVLVIYIKLCKCREAPNCVFTGKSLGKSIVCESETLKREAKVSFGDCKLKRKLKHFSTHNCVHEQHVRNA